MTKGIFSKWAEAKAISSLGTVSFLGTVSASSAKLASKAMLMVAFVFSVVFAANTVVAQDVATDASNWGYLPLEFSFSSGGNGSEFKTLPAATNVHNVRYVSAILSATDSNKNVFGSNNNWRDGSVDHANTAGKLLNRLFYKVSSSNQGPIIANIESSDTADTSRVNEPLNMVAVIQNVSSAVVTALRNEAPGGPTAQAIINRITAEFSTQIFGSNPNNVTFKNIRPTSVTGVIDLGDGQPGEPKKTGVSLGLQQSGEATVNFSTMILVRWDQSINSSLIAGATNRAVAGFGGLNATITINGANPGPSNLIGLEVDGFGDSTTVNSPRLKSGPDIVYTGAGGPADMTLTDVYDTVSRLFRFGGDSLDSLALTSAEANRVPNTNMFTPWVNNAVTDSVIRLTTPVGVLNSGAPRQYRASDVIVIQTRINANSNLDGEPDDYFGGSNTDPIAVGDLGADAPSTLKNFFSPLNGSGEVKTASSTVRVQVKSVVDNEDVARLNLATVSVKSHGIGSFDTGGGAGNGTALTGAALVGDNVVVTATFPVSTSLITSGQHEQFTFNLLVADDIGFSTNATNGRTANDNKYFVDTLGPVLTRLNISAENADHSITSGQTNWRAQRVFSRTANWTNRPNVKRRDAMLVDIGVNTNGEPAQTVTGSNHFSNFINISIDPDRNNELGWNNKTSLGGVFSDSINFANLGNSSDFNTVTGNNYANSVVVGASSANLVPTSAGGQLLGVSATAKFFHHVDRFINSSTAHVIVSVSDDARNPAIGWVTGRNTIDDVDANAIRSYGSKTFSGTSRTPSVELSSATDTVIALNNAISGTSVFSTLGASTLYIDNNPPRVLSATLTVMNLPESYLVGTSSSDQKKIFNNLLNIPETRNVPGNANVISNGPLKGHASGLAAWKAIEQLQIVARGTAKATSTVNNTTANASGSPLRLILDLDLNGISTSVENSALGFQNKNGEIAPTKEIISSFIKNNYRFEVSSPALGFSTKSIRPLPGGWTLVDFATRSELTSNQVNIVRATLETTVGILDARDERIRNADPGFEGVDNLQSTVSLSDASIHISVSDPVGNFSLVPTTGGTIGTTASRNTVDQNGITHVVGQSIASTTIIVDVSGPSISFGNLNGDDDKDPIDELSGKLRDGNGAASDVVLLVTDTAGKGLRELSEGFLSSPGILNNRPDRNLTGAIATLADATEAHIALFSGHVAAGGDYTSGVEAGGSRTETSFINSRATNANDLTGVQGISSGFMIIVSATFGEIVDTNDARKSPILINNSFASTFKNGNVSLFQGAYPFLIDPNISITSGSTPIGGGASLSVGDTLDVDTPATNFGSLFKTVSANFSDFVVSAKEVLPDVSRAVNFRDGSQRNIAAARFGDIVEATWFFVIDVDAEVNGSIASNAVRGVTLRAKDLSGNVSSKYIPVATADFAVPTVTVNNFRISNSKRGLSSIEITGGAANGKSISAATFNNNDATVVVVAKVTGSTLRTSAQSTSIQSPVTIDFRALGGSAGVQPSATSTIPANVAISSLTSGDVLFATFIAGPFKDKGIVTRNDQPGNTGAQIIITATGSSNTSVQTKTEAIDVDQVAPSFYANGTSLNGVVHTLNSILERNLSNNPTASLFDNNQTDDGTIRPGQVFTVGVAIDTTRSTKGTEGDNNGSSNTITGNFSEFGLGTSITPSIVRNDVAGNAFKATWQLTVNPTLDTKAAKATFIAIDPAGNSSTGESNTVFVQSARPQVVQTNLQIAKLTGSATNTAIVTNTKVPSFNFAPGKESKETSKVPAIEFNLLGTRNNDQSITLPSFKGSYPNSFGVTPILGNIRIPVKNGDRIKIDSRAIISDSNFSNVEISADMSQAFASVPAGLNNNGVTTVFPQSKPIGGDVVASWDFLIDNLVTQSTTAEIIINATIGSADSFRSIDTATRSVQLLIDNVKPEVSMAVQWFKGGKAKTSSEVFSSNPIGATAGVIVYATLTDASDLLGYIGAPIAAAHGSVTSVSSITSSLISLNTREFFRSSTTSNNVNNSTQGILIPDYFAISNQTGKLSSDEIKLVTIGSPVADIASSTGTVLTAWFGIIPTEARNEGFVVRADNEIKINQKNNSSAEFVASVSDTAGNIGTVKSTSVELDGNAPVVLNTVNSKANPTSDDNNPFFLDIANSSTKHLPAIYGAEGRIQTLTRVAFDSRLRAVFTVKDSPDGTEKIFATIKGHEFGIDLGVGNFSVTAANATDVVSVAKGTTNTPLKADIGEIDVEIVPTDGKSSEITVEFTATKNGVNTPIAGVKTSSFPLDLNDIWEAETPGVLDFGYNGAVNSLNVNQFRFSNGAKLFVDVTDTEGNAASYNSDRLDYDMEAPAFLKNHIGNQEFAIFGSSTNEGLNVSRAEPRTSNRDRLKTLFTVDTRPVSNLTTGSWIIFSGSVVVDGADAKHLPLMNVDWAEALEQDIDRLVVGSVSSGSQVVVNSVTPAARAVRFITSTVQIRSNASPSNAQIIPVDLGDFFGNNSTINTERVAISAAGPGATEMTLFINGVSQVGNTSNLSIGNGGPDSSIASFEIAPGDVVELEAIINSVAEGRAPQTITANLSDFYPHELFHSVNQIVPSATAVTPDGTVLAKWSNVSADVSVIYSTTVNNSFLDLSLLRNRIINGVAVALDDGVLENGLISGVTISTASSIATTGGFVAPVAANILQNVQGLPKIQVQPNATAKRSASVTVTVNERPPVNLFGQTRRNSTRFAVDTKTPEVTWLLPWENIVRELNVPASGLVGFDRSTGAVNPQSARSRVGFPTTPVLSSQDSRNVLGTSIFDIPARVRGADIVTIIADVTNPTIAGTGDDRFRPFPGDTFDASTLFSISDTSQLQDIHADLSEFGGPAFSNVSLLDQTFSDISDVFTVTQQTGKASRVTVKYTLTVSKDIALTAAASRLNRDVTLFVTDDAGNKPFDTFQTRGANQTLNKIKKLVRPGGIGVDNRAPTISGVLDAIVSAGPNQGSVLQSGSRIVGGSLLSITASINESVDSPLDVLNNPNFGSVLMSAQGITIPADGVILLTSFAQLSGNSVLVPFQVQIPEVTSGVSTSNFRFIITATDSIGNATSRVSNDSFQFDARPDVRFVDASIGEETANTITLHAGAPALALSANAFDVGGVQTNTITVDPDSTVLSSNGITVTSDFVGNGGADVQNVNVPLFISAVPEVGNIPFIIASADAVDIDGAIGSDAVTININRPALFADMFGMSVLDSSGISIGGATQLAGLGSLEAAGVDVREVTIPEGSTLEVAVRALDGDATDTVVLSATGSVFSNVIEDATFGNGIDASGNLTSSVGNSTLIFKPGFRAVTGAASASVFDVTIASADSAGHPTRDFVTLRVNVEARAAHPVVDIVSIDLTDLSKNGTETLPATENDTALFPENRDVKIVVVSTDAGDEELAFNASVDTELVIATEQTAATGIVTATITFRLGFDDANRPDIVSLIDPTLLTLTAANSVNTFGVTKVIDITNSSQPANLSATVGVNGNTPNNVAIGSRIEARPGDVIQLFINAVDPDGDTFDFPSVTSVGPDTLSIIDEIVSVGPGATQIESLVTITVSQDVTSDANRASITYSIQEDTLDALITNATFEIFVDTEDIGPVVQIDEMIISQAAGGQELVHVRNFDETAGTRNQLIDQFRSIGDNALTTWGGGTGRGTFVSSGEIDGDGTVDIVTTFGSITAEATFPNMVIAINALTKQLIGNSFHAFPNGDSNENVVRYSGGELTTAIGDFLVDGENMVAVAQGAGSKISLVRIYRYSPDTVSTNSHRNWRVVAQFQPLDNVPNLNNANGGVSLDAADIDGDGLAELIVGQRNSATSLTQFTVIDITADGKQTRKNFVAFPPSFRGDGGVNVVGTDLNGDNVNELVFTSGGVRTAEDLGSLVTVVVPTVDGNQVTGFTRPGGISIQQLATNAVNPGGGLSISAGELDGDNTNGQELLIGSGPGAPQSFFRVVKLGFNGNDVSGATFLIGPAGNIGFVNSAFTGNFEPTSGAVNVEAANHTVRQ